MPSALGGVPGEPVVFPRRKYTLVIEHMHLGFVIYSKFRDADHLIEELRDAAVMVPYGQIDGLGARIGRIVDRMEEDIAAGVPRAVRSAQVEVVAATKAQVAARVRAGDVVVR